MVRIVGLSRIRIVGLSLFLSLLTCCAFVDHIGFWELLVLCGMLVASLTNSVLDLLEARPSDKLSILGTMLPVAMLCTARYGLLHGLLMLAGVPALFWISKHLGSDWQTFVVLGVCCLTITHSISALFLYSILSLAMLLLDGALSRTHHTIIPILSVCGVLVALLDIL